jgi:tetraacyldisaccharide 4'-kinase
MARRGALAAATEALLLRHWWRPQPSWLMRLLQPLAALHGWLLRRSHRGADAAARTPVPVVVVGNLVVGGAGKTPVVMALVAALQQAGFRPGIVSRGYGRSTDDVAEVHPHSTPTEVGDEPLLLRRRTGVPVWVGRQRAAAAQALCSRHPEVDVLVSDDGLQHRALARVAEWVVFDERGAGNGLLLPAGPLREPLPLVLPPQRRVLYNAARPTTALPGTLLPRRIGQVLPLQAWWQGDASQAVPLQQLRGRPLLALAGIGAPAKFFAMLEAAGLQATPCPQPDHADYTTLPWPAGTTEVVTSEKDAVKLQPGAVGAVRVWVARLDLDLPADLVRDLVAALRRASNEPTP